MNPQVVVPYWQDRSPEDGILFVRTKGILTTMVRATLVAVGLIVMAISMPIQSTFGTIRTLELIVYPDGTTHISSEISADPLEPDFAVKLFGTIIDNFVAQDENGFLLSANIEEDSALVETLGSSTISVNYDIQDLVSKEGRIWSFKIDSPVEYSLLMPSNIVIVGMSTYPLNMQMINERSQLLLPSGPVEINYFFGVSQIPQTPTPNPEQNSDNSIYFIGGGIAAAGAIAAVFMKRSKGTTIKKITETIVKQEQITEKSLDVETIFELRPELRDDDKQLVSFISANGGQAYESELRKKFLQPRTTMWRAVKRLERYGIVEIDKKEFELGSTEIESLIKASKDENIPAAREHFLSAMKIFNEIIQQISERTSTSETALSASQPAEAPRISNEIDRSERYIDQLKGISDKNGFEIDFSHAYELIDIARNQLGEGNSKAANSTIEVIKRSISELNETLREKTRQYTTDRAKTLAEKYLEDLDILIAEAEEVGVSQETLAKLVEIKEHLNSASDSSDVEQIINELRYLISVKQDFEDTKIERLKSRANQLESKIVQLKLGI